MSAHYEISCLKLRLQNARALLSHAPFTPPNFLCRRLSAASPDSVLRADIRYAGVWNGLWWTVSLAQPSSHPLFVARLNSDVISIPSGDPVELIISFVGKSHVVLIPVCIPDSLLLFETKEYVLYGHYSASTPPLNFSLPTGGLKACLMPYNDFVFSLVYVWLFCLSLSSLPRCDIARWPLNSPYGAGAVETIEQITESRCSKDDFVALCDFNVNPCARVKLCEQVEWRRAVEVGQPYQVPL